MTAALFIAAMIVAIFGWEGIRFWRKQSAWKRRWKVRPSDE